MINWYSVNATKDSSINAYENHALPHAHKYTTWTADAAIISNNDSRLCFSSSFEVRAHSTSAMMSNGKNTLYASVSTNPAIVLYRNVDIVANDKLAMNANNLLL